MRRTITLFVLICISFLGPAAVHAQGPAAYDLANEVNALRASQGLAAYNVDPALMAYAQQHSDYMAATLTSTHLHSDGTLPQSIGLQENVAGGDVEIMTTSIVVNEIWVDYGHRHILTGYTYGDIGAGWALGDDGLIYCSVNIRPLKDAPTYAPPAGTARPFTPYGTSTPDQNGSIYHVVSAGQTLWSIAISYGTTLDEIRRLNSLPSDWSTVYPNQKLLIRKDVPTVPAQAPAAPPDEAPNEVDTAPAASATMQVSASAPPASVPPSITPAVTSTPAARQLGVTQYVSLALVVVLIMVIIAAFVFGIIDLMKREK